MITYAKVALYEMVDICTLRRGIRRVISDEEIRFPPRWSRFYPPDYEPYTFRFLRSHRAAGATVMDIGAHLGLFGVVMARLVGPAGRVYSFEPTPLSRKVLQETVRINGCVGIVEVRPEAVAGATGKAVFYDTGSPASNANSLVRTAKSKSGITLDKVRLDDFVASRQLNVTCLKIDVEGAELDLLRGARQMLLTCRPAVLLSIHPMAIKESGGSLAEIWQLLQDCGMSVRLPEEVHPARLDVEPIGSDWFCDRTSPFEVECIPRS